MADKSLKHVHDSIKTKFKDKKLVFGRGLLDPKIVFVSEMLDATGEMEGKPLAGQAEKLLNQLLKTAGIDKKKVYVTNVVKYYPHGQFAPTPKEIKSHAHFLKEELKIVNPQVVVTLGNLALNGVGLRQPLDNVHGRVFNFGSYSLLATFHPDHALKDPSVKSLLAADFLKLKELLKNQPEQA